MDRPLDRVESTRRASEERACRQREQQEGQCSWNIVIRGHAGEMSSVRATRRLGSMEAQNPDHSPLRITRRQYPDQLGQNLWEWSPGISLFEIPR